MSTRPLADAAARHRAALRQPGGRRRAALRLPGAVVVTALVLTGCGAAPPPGADGARPSSSSPAPPATTGPGPSTAAPTAPTTPTPDGTPPPAAPPTPAATPAESVDVAAADRLLAGLPVKGRAPKTGYSREQFGPAWADVDADRCDSRNQLLQSQLSDVRLEPGSRCVVLEGDLADPYTGRTIHFVRAGTYQQSVDVDHLVALGDAWQKGAQQLTAEQREAFANDPANLQAADPSANRQKGDGDAATWLPANTAFRCRYVAAQVAVKAAYGLWVTAAERDAIVRVLRGCAG